MAKTVKLPLAKRPIVPGSNITNRQLKRTTRAAMDVKYGPLQAQEKRGVQQARNYARDVGGPGGFYDQYLAELAKHTANINTIGQQANAAVGALPGQVTGLAQADTASLQGQANAGAAARGMGPAGDLTGMASDATAIRQALTGSFAAEQAARNAAAQTYADTLAHVVGPTQKLAGQAVAQGKIKSAREKVTETKAQRGASALQYREDTKAAEAKNILASKIAGVGAATKVAAQTETTRTHKANEKLAQERIDASQAAADKAAADKANTPNKYGITNAKWATMTQGARQKIIKNYGAKTGSTLSPKDVGEAMTQVTQLRDLAALAKAGKPFDPSHAKGWKNKPLSRPDAAKKLIGFATKLKDPVLASAALDVVYNRGTISPGVAKRLRDAGYDPKRVASTLGARLGSASDGTPHVVVAPSGHGKQQRPT